MASSPLVKCKPYFKLRSSVRRFTAKSTVSAEMAAAPSSLVRAFPLRGI